MSEQQYQLIVQKGPQPGKLFILMTDSITIGRDPMADISLNDPEVSRQHMRLTKTEAGYELVDLGSTNGTFIDGNKLAADTPVLLASGQTISMGSGVTVLYEAILPETAQPDEPEDELFDAFSPAVPDLGEEDLFDPALEESPVLPEWSETPLPPAAPPAAAPQPQTPLVPSGDSDQQKKRRRMISIAVASVILLCCCCLVFLLTAYYVWGDPLMQSLGVY